MGDTVSDAKSDRTAHGREKRRVNVTQLLRSAVLNAAGEQLGRVEDFIAKLTDGGYPPITGLKVNVGGHDVFVGRQFIERLEPGAIRLNTNTVDMTQFQRRPGEVLLSADVLGRHLMDVARGRIVQANDLVLSQADGEWRLLGVDRSPRAMLRRLVPRRKRPDLRRHVLLDWKDVQPFVGHVPTAKLLMPSSACAGCTRPRSPTSWRGRRTRGARRSSRSWEATSSSPLTFSKSWTRSTRSSS